MTNTENSKIEDAAVNKIIVEMSLVPDFYRLQEREGLERTNKVVNEIPTSYKEAISNLSWWLFEQTHTLHSRSKTPANQRTISIITDDKNEGLNKISDVLFDGFLLNINAKTEKELNEQIIKTGCNIYEKIAAKNLFFFRQAMLHEVKEMYGKHKIHLTFDGQHHQFSLNGKINYPHKPEHNNMCDEFDILMAYAI